MIDGKKLIKIFMCKGKDKLRLSTVINEIEMLEKFGTSSPLDNLWIPCSDQFPDNDNYILLSFENFSLPLVGRYEEDEDGGAFYVGDDDENCTCISCGLFVNAWMPLPEPYKQNDE